MAEGKGQFLKSQGKLPRLIFVTGGPGTGKGTQCANLVEHNGFKHVSIGDLVRAEIKSGSEVGQSIESIVKSGNLVPKELVVNLLAQALQRTKAHTLLVDGFPRDTQQAVYLEQLNIRIDYILHYEADSDDVLLQRLLERGRTSGRADDNEETIIHRFQVYKSESIPVLALYEPFNIIHRVNCMGSIQEVYLRTLRTLRPELVCVMGPLSAGKTVVAKEICKKYELEYLDFAEVKAGPRTEDDLIQSLIRKLASYKHQYRVLVDGFPETLSQARLFSSLSGDPDYVIYIHCPKDVCQERILRLGKTDKGYMPSAEISKKYLEFATEGKGMKMYYSKHLGPNFKEIDGGTDQKFLVQSQAFQFIEPEVVLVRGEIIPSFLDYLRDTLGFRLINAANILRLWRQARALSPSDDLSSLSDDSELVPLLKSLIYSGTKGRKFALYNFSLTNFSLFRDFDMLVATIKQVFFLYRNQTGQENKLTTGYFNLPEKQEKITEHLFCLHKATAIPIDGLHPYSPLSDGDSAYFTKVLSEQSQTQSAHFVWIYGPKLSGKTTTAKLLTTLFGFQVIDYNAVIEETKAALSTEEEPKEALNFTEFCDGLKVYLAKRVGQTFVSDGIPDLEIMMLPGGKDFKDLDLPEGGEGEVALEEDPAVVLKMTLISERWESLFRKYLSSASHSILQISTPQDVLIKRGRKAAELTDEDETPAELLSEITESELWGYYLSQRRYFPGVLEEYHRYTVPGSVLAETKALMELIFTRRLILFKNFHLFGTTEVIKRLCYKYRMCYLNFFAICDTTMRTDTPLAHRLKQAKLTQSVLPFDLKIEVLSSFMQQHVPLRVKFVVLTNYEFQGDGDFPNCFDELAALEKVVGKMHGFVNVTHPEQVESGQMEDLPVRIRKRVKQPGEEDEEEVKKDPADEENPEVVAAPPEPEEPEVTPMWNNYQPSNLTLTFQHFKGMPAQYVQIEAEASTIISDLEIQLENVVQHLETRWNVQYIIPKKLGKTLEAAVEAAKKQLIGSMEYYERLPLDISELGNYSKKMERLLVNPHAKEFHQKYLKQLTVPFSTFFHYFTPIIESAGIKVTAGLRKAIGSVIDSNRNSCVSADELSQFFDLWENEGKKQQILRDAHTKDAEARARSEPLGYQIVLVVVDAIEDPMTGSKTFEVGRTFEIGGEGMSDSKRFCGDGVTLIGKENRVVQNDIVFDPADTRVKNHHFSILSLSSGYYVTDAGTLDGVRLRLEDTPILLRTNLLLLFNSSDKCFIGTCGVESSVRHSSEPFLDKLEYLSSSDPHVTLSEGPSLEFEFIAGFHYGKKITLRASEKRRFLVGGGKDCDVYLPDSPVMLQAWIEYGTSGWTLLDMQSGAENWVYVNSYDRVVAERPSLPLKLRNNTNLAIPGTVFKVLYKQTQQLDLSLPTSPVVRRVRFRDVYTINRRMGKGVYESVFQCTHKGSKVQYAVKMIEKAKIDPETMGQLVVLKSYDHPGVCRVQDIVEEARTIYVIAEMATGEDVISPLLRKESITEDVVASLLRDMSAPLSYLHSKSTPHLDIKPDSFHHVTSDPASSLKLIDFAAVRLLQPSFRPSERLASHHYVAPEVVKGKGDAKSDVWSLGAILYVMFCGQAPYPGRTEQEVMEKTKAGKPTFKEVGWKKVSKTARRLIGSMLNPSPAQRPTAAEVLSHPWTQQRSKSVNYTKPLADKAFKNLKSYSTNSKLQQALLQYIASTQLTAKERDSIAAWFTEVDKDASGFVSADELKKGFVGAGMEISDEEVDRLVRDLDTNRTGMLNYSEFLSALAARTVALSKERLNGVFAAIDADASGDLTTAELKAVLGQTDEAWRPLLEQIDGNKDGKIDAKEFKELMLGLIG